MNLGAMGWIGLTVLFGINPIACIIVMVLLCICEQGRGNQA